jgi:hypothetical protein
VAVFGGKREQSVRDGSSKFQDREPKQRNLEKRYIQFRNQAKKITMTKPKSLCYRQLTDEYIIPKLYSLQLIASCSIP